MPALFWSTATGPSPASASRWPPTGAGSPPSTGWADGDRLHPVQTAFLDLDGYQRGYRTPGQTCSAVAVVEEQAAGRPSAVTTDVPKPSITSSMRTTDMLGQQFPKVRHMLLDAKDDLPAFAAFPISLWKKIHIRALKVTRVIAPRGTELAPARVFTGGSSSRASRSCTGSAGCASAGRSATTSTKPCLTSIPSRRSAPS